MPTALKLSTDLVDAARPHAAAMHRSVSKQIEHWARIGKAAEENPDLPGSFIQDILLAKEEEKAGLAEPYSLDQ